MRGLLAGILAVTLSLSTSLAASDPISGLRAAVQQLIDHSEQELSKVDTSDCTSLTWKVVVAYLAALKQEIVQMRANAHSGELLDIIANASKREGELRLGLADRAVKAGCLDFAGQVR